MNALPDLTLAEGPADERSGRLASIGSVLWTPEGLLGLAMILAATAVFVVGPLLAPYDPTSVGVGIPASGPDSEHLLGTDGLGRDVLSRFLNGGASVLLVPLGAVSLAFLLGGSAGLVAGYVGGRFDAVVTRVVDTLLPIPSLLIALLLIARFGGGAWVLTLIVAVVFAPRIARVMRGAVQNVRLMEYVLAAELRGEPKRNVVFREILPNVAAPAFVEFGVRVNYAVVFVASLNFLGLAAEPPSSNWGLMIAEGRDIIGVNPYPSVVPAIAIGTLVVGINLVTDAAARHFSRELGGRTKP